MKYADLHVHTYFSDSTFSPEEVITLSKEKELDAVSICDHDTVEGLEPTFALGVREGIEVIPGIEMTAESKDTEIHILGYCFDWKNAEFLAKLKEIQLSRIERVYTMTDKLRTAGIFIKPEDIFATAGKGTVGRLHVAKAMLNNGQIRSIREAFDNYIGFNKSCYVSYTRFSPGEVIGIILAAGGVPVLAHPAVMGSDNMIKELIKLGLRGIEVYHSDHDKKDELRYSNMAKKSDLIETGGSDCHGLGKRTVLLGTIKVPYDTVEKLKDEAGKIKAAGIR